MARLSELGIRLSSMNPSFLNSNSTSHTWPFSAVAELTDNATDPGVSAKQIWIDAVDEGGQRCLTFTDNGSGMTPRKLHKMLSFGFTEKGSSKCIQQAIGIYGNGFKSGSMRLGRDALVFTKNGGCQTVGMLSQTYLENIKAQAVIVPIVPFRQQNKSLVITEDSQASLAAILENSILMSVEQIHAHFDSIPSKKGTKILIWNIRRAKDGKPEIDFETDVSDFRLPPIQIEELKRSMRSGSLKAVQNIPEIQYSLRAYLSILYLRPRTQIILRGERIMAKLVSKRLTHIEHDVYKPQFDKEKIKVTFGLSPEDKDHYGIMMYHKNRLIKSYEKVGCQLKASSQRAGVGVIGVVECNFLKPAHNKQDFEYTKEYRLTLGALGQKLNDYWKEVSKNKGRDRKAQTAGGDESEDEHDEDETPWWLQCEECLKWRSIAAKHYNALPENWTCSQNPNPRYRSCSAPEEVDSEELLTPSYQKNHRNKGHPKSRKQRKTLEDQAAKHQIPTQSSSACPSTCTPPHRRTEEDDHTEGNTAEKDQVNGCHLGDDGARTQQRPLVRTALIDDKAQEEERVENETHEESSEMQDANTEALEREERNTGASSFKRKLASLLRGVEKKPRLQEEEQLDSGETSPNKQTNVTQTLPSDKTSRDRSIPVEKPSDIGQRILSNHSRTHSLPFTQTVMVSPLNRTEGPCSMEESDQVANMQKLARLEREAQRLRGLLGLEITKATQGTMTTGHCSRDVGCQASGTEDQEAKKHQIPSQSSSEEKTPKKDQANGCHPGDDDARAQQRPLVRAAVIVNKTQEQSSTSTGSRAQCPERQEKMPKKRAETPGRMRASGSEACEDSRRPSQETLRAIRSNMMVLLTALLPQLDLSGVSLDTSDLDNILQQIIEVNALKL